MTPSRKDNETTLIDGFGRKVELKVTNFEFDGHPLVVATDFMGSNIIYGGRKDKIHMMSWDLESHTKAVEIAEDIMAGKRTVESVCIIRYK